jgi:hypothetical protein
MRFHQAATPPRKARTLRRRDQDPIASFKQILYLSRPEPGDVSPTTFPKIGTFGSK